MRTARSGSSHSRQVPLPWGTAHDRVLEHLFEMYLSLAIDKSGEKLVWKCVPREDIMSVLLNHRIVCSIWKVYFTQG